MAPVIEWIGIAAVIVLVLTITGFIPIPDNTAGGALGQPPAKDQASSDATPGQLPAGTKTTVLPAEGQDMGLPAAANEPTLSDSTNQVTPFLFSSEELGTDGRYLIIGTGDAFSLYSDKLGLVENPAQTITYIVELDEKSLLGILAENQATITDLKTGSASVEKERQIAGKILSQKRTIHGKISQVGQEAQKIVQQKENNSGLNAIQARVVREYYHVFSGLAITANGLTREDLEAIPGVKKAFLSRQVKAVLEDTANVTRVSDAWQLNALQPALTPLTGKGTTIAVIDTGIDYTHADLGGCFAQPLQFEGAAIICDQSPCTADESRIISRDTIFDQAEPNQPNTVSPVCSDGTQGFYPYTLSVDRITVSNPQGGPFAKNQEVQVDVVVNCWGSSNRSLNLSYWSEKSNWRVITSQACTGTDPEVKSFSFYLDNTAGYHVIRASADYGLDPQSFCATSGSADNDDVVLTVERPTDLSQLDCKVIGGYDFVNNDNDPMDDHFHGTHVAGIAAGNGLLMGIAKDAKLLAYKVLSRSGSGDTADVVAALDRALDPNQDGDFSDAADVINLSLGMLGTPDDELSTAVDAIVDSGVVVVVAAGNLGPQPNTILSPGTARKAITVGATYKTNYYGSFWGDIDPTPETITRFSSRGPVIWSGGELTKPDVVAPGAFICSARFDNVYDYGIDDYYHPCEDDKHIQIAGTSMAAPVVAGFAALLRQKHPDWTPQQIKDQMMQTADLLPGYSEFDQGSGRINAKRALTDKPEEDYYSLEPRLVYNSSIKHDPSQPTFEYTFTVVATNNNPEQTVNFDFSNSGDNFVKIEPKKFSLPVLPLSKAEAKLSVIVDNDAAVAGETAKPFVYAEVRENKSMVPVQKIRVDLRFKIRDFLSVTNTEALEFGIDEPALPSWEKSATIGIKNNREDAPQTVNVYFKGIENWPTGIVPSLSETGFVLGPKEEKLIDVALSVPDNSAVPNGKYEGIIALDSPQQHTEFAFSFIKAYVINVYFPDSDEAFTGYARNVETGYYKTWNYSDVDPQKDIVEILLDYPGTYDAISMVYDYDLPFPFQGIIVKEDVTVQPEANLTVSTNEANHSVQASFRDRYGEYITITDHTINGIFIGSGLESENPIALGFQMSTNLSDRPYEIASYSTFSERHSLAFGATRGQQGFHNDGVYVAFNQSGLNNDLFFDTTPDNFQKIQIQNNPKPSTVPKLISSIKRAYHGASMLDTISPTDDYSTLEIDVYKQPENGLGRFAVANCLYGTPCWPTDNGMISGLFYVAPSGLKYNVGLYLNSPEFSDPDMSSEQAVAGLDLQYWNGKLKNQKTGNGVFLSVSSYTNDNSLPFATAYPFLTQHGGYNGDCGVSIPLYLSKDGESIDARQSFMCRTSYTPTFFDYELTEPGNYETIAGQWGQGYYVYNNSEKISLTTWAKSRFSVPKIPTDQEDFNPPSIKFFRFYNGTTAAAIMNTSPSVQNRFVFELDPISGTIAQVELRRVDTLNYQLPGNPQPIELTPMGENKFEAILPKLSAGESIILEIFATDDSGNSLTTRFDVPYRYLAFCGNGLVDPGEQCDGTDLNGTTCEDFGYGGGVLQCTTECQFDTSGCTGSTLCGPGHTPNPDGTCTAEIMATTSDGTVFVSSPPPADWNELRNRTFGTANSTSQYFSIDNYFSSLSNSIIDRGAVPFDTSSIPASSQVLSAELSFKKITSVNSFPLSSDFIVAVPTTLANPPVLTNEDFDQIGSIDNPEELSERFDESTHPGDNIPITMQLTPQGLEYINIGGLTVFGLRGGYDLSSNPPNNGAETYFYVTFASANSTIDEKPKLIVTYQPS